MPLPSLRGGAAHPDPDPDPPPTGATPRPASALSYRHRPHGSRCLTDAPAFPQANYSPQTHLPTAGQG